ncbi:hypothetical protein [Geobacter grbiciae]|uniref:hypothetical protein n=1 Tax=Geobacter grbiciae TaxID=155042 RepID=UPI001C00E675|nr:hypothetical protein [Geobacter grbiciae]MBT1073974.1 hypothetical protein [Geobacter grbiciae]
MGADSFARQVEPAMQLFGDGYKQGLYDWFNGGQSKEELLEDELFAKGSHAELEGEYPVSLIPPMLIVEVSSLAVPKTPETCPLRSPYLRGFRFSVFAVPKRVGCGTYPSKRK